jgi:hypothetical protein
MTIAEAHIEFDITLDKRFTSQTPEFPPEVVDYFMNEGLARYVKTRYGKNNLYRAGFEEIQKRTDDLKNIVKTVIIETEPVDYEENVDRVDIDLAPGYWFFLRGRVLVNNESCGDKWKKLTLVQQDDLETVEGDPFNKTYYDEPVGYFEDGDIFVQNDGSFTTPKYKLTYLRKPAVVNVGTYGGPVVEFDMPEHTHKEIVQFAAMIAVENIESPRVQTLIPQRGEIE